MYFLPLCQNFGCLALVQTTMDSHRELVSVGAMLCLADSISRHSFHFFDSNILPSPLPWALVVGGDMDVLFRAEHSGTGPQDCD